MLMTGGWFGGWFIVSLLKIEGWCLNGIVDDLQAVAVFGVTFDRSMH